MAARPAGCASRTRRPAVDTTLTSSSAPGRAASCVRCNQAAAAAGDDDVVADAQEVTRLTAAAARTGEKEADRAPTDARVATPLLSELEAATCTAVASAQSTSPARERCAASAGTLALVLVSRYATAAAAAAAAALAAAAAAVLAALPPPMTSKNGCMAGGASPLLVSALTATTSVSMCSAAPCGRATTSSTPLSGDAGAAKAGESSCKRARAGQARARQTCARD